MRYWHLPVAQWRQYARTPVRRNYGTPVLRYTGAHGCRGASGAPGLRCAGTPVRRDSGTLAPTIAAASAVRRDSGTKGRPRLPCACGAPGLRCAGTPVPKGVQGYRARAVRRDSGAPGLRCAGTPVRRDSGAPRGHQFHRRGPAAPLLPRTAWNNERRRPPWSSDRSLDPSRLGAERPPREFHLASWIYPDPPLPTSDRP